MSLLTAEPLFYDREQAAAVVGLSVALIEAEVRAGRFPAPRQLSARRVGWLRREIEEWAEARPVSELLPPKNTGKRSHAEAL
jgi:prophage regulatory protein